MSRENAEVDSTSSAPAAIGSPTQRSHSRAWFWVLVLLGCSMGLMSPDFMSWFSPQAPLNDQYASKGLHIRSSEEFDRVVAIFGKINVTYMADTSFALPIDKQLCSPLVMNRRGQGIGYILATKAVASKTWKLSSAVACLPVDPADGRQFPTTFESMSSFSMWFYPWLSEWFTIIPPAKAVVQNDYTSSGNVVLKDEHNNWRYSFDENVAFSIRPDNFTTEGTSSMDWKTPLVRVKPESIVDVEIQHIRSKAQWSKYIGYDDHIDCGDGSLGDWCQGTRFVPWMAIMLEDGEGLRAGRKP